MWVETGHYLTDKMSGTRKGPDGKWNHWPKWFQRAQLRAKNRGEVKGKENYTPLEEGCSNITSA